MRCRGPRRKCRGRKAPGSALATELLQAAELKMRGSALISSRSPAFDAFDANPAAPVSTEDLERCPLLAVSIREESHLVSVAEEGSLGAEKFRFLAVRLRQLRQNRPLKKILITSTIPQEGKSTVAANLACTLARRRQQKTLLLEGDLRRPNIVTPIRNRQASRFVRMAEWTGRKHQYLQIGESRTLDSAGRRRAGKSVWN